ncbi:MAG: aldo/keto reductase [Candidatus Nanopelagicaceae bacterium]|jgi:aryl-alcohol dehydrogenase-like predicted oxidoreductase
MEKRPVGASGLHVSRLGLGTMTWGRDTDEQEAADQLRLFLDAGGNFIDTAAIYGDGDSERVLGGLIDAMAKREDLVIASKAGISIRGGERKVDNSRKALLAELDRSLTRLGTEYLDIWQISTWDEEVPLEETLGALDSAVSSGKARYVGVTNFSGWQTARAATLQNPIFGKAPISSTQNELSLLNRSCEREVLGAAKALGLGFFAWSPLGRGVLTGKYRRGLPSDSRGASPHFSSFIEPYLSERSAQIVEAVLVAADGLGLSPIEISIAWVRDLPGVSAALIGARTGAQIKGILTSEAIVLPAPVREALDDVTAPEKLYLN